MFNSYESKPITRMAVQILDEVYECDEPNTYIFKGVKFKAYQTPKHGDYVVRLTDNDTYHVDREVFRERNFVPESDY